MLPPGSLEGLSCFPGSLLLTQVKALKLQDSAGSVGMGEPSPVIGPCPDVGATGKGMSTWAGWEEEGGEHQGWSQWHQKTAPTLERDEDPLQQQHYRNPAVA